MRKFTAPIFALFLMGCAVQHIEQVVTPSKNWIKVNSKITTDQVAKKESECIVDVYYKGMWFEQLAFNILILNNSNDTLIINPLGFLYTTNCMGENATSNFMEQIVYATNPRVEINNLNLIIDSLVACENKPSVNSTNDIDVQPLNFGSEATLTSQDPQDYLDNAEAEELRFKKERISQIGKLNNELEFWRSNNLETIIVPPKVNISQMVYFRSINCASTIKLEMVVCSNNNYYNFKQSIEPSE